MNSRARMDRIVCAERVAPRVAASIDAALSYAQYIYIPGSAGSSVDRGNVVREVRLGVVAA